MGAKAVRDVDLQGDVADIREWEAWSVSADGGTIAVAPHFGATGGVTIDARSGQTHKAEGRLVDSDHPIFWIPEADRFEDVDAKLVYHAPHEEANSADAIAFRNDGHGVFTRLIRDRQGGRIRLQAWNHQTEMAWSVELNPAKATAGTAISPLGDLVVTVQSDPGRSIEVQALDANSGVVRWRHTSSLHGVANSTSLRQSVLFSDDGATVWIAGKQGDPTKDFVEALASRDGSALRVAAVPRLPADGGAFGAVSAAVSPDRFWVGIIAHSNGGDGFGPPRWLASYTLAELGSAEPIVDTDLADADARAVFGEQGAETARTLRPIGGGGIMLVQVRDRGLRLTTWQRP